MRAKAAYHQRIRIIAASDVTHLCFADLGACGIEERDSKIALTVILIHGESDFPLVGDTIRRQRPIPVLRFEALFAVEIGAHRGTEHPVVPRVSYLRGRARRRAIT